MLILSLLLKGLESQSGPKKLGAALRAATTDDLANLILDIEELERPSETELAIKEMAGQAMRKAILTKGAPQRRQLGTNDDLWARPEDPGPTLMQRPNAIPTPVPALTPEPPKPF